MGNTPREIAEKALEAARVAAETARMVKSAVDGIMPEIRERLGRQDTNSKEFRDWVRNDRIEQSRKFDAFKSDFDLMDNRCQRHDDVIYGNKERNLVGVVTKVDGHDSKISQGVWTLGIISSLVGAFWGYMLVFHLEDMKRGIFNPTEEEQTRLINRQIMKMVPGTKWPVPPPAPATPNFLKPAASPDAP